MNANEARWWLKRYLEKVECGHKRYDPAVVKGLYREIAHFIRKKRRRREHSRRTLLAVAAAWASSGKLSPAPFEGGRESVEIFMEEKEDE